MKDNALQTALKKLNELRKLKKDNEAWVKKSDVENIIKEMDVEMLEGFSEIMDDIFKIE